MSTISSIGSSQWPAAATQRQPNARMAEKALAKMDQDGSGGISQSEFQTAIDDISSKAGVSLNSKTEDVFRGADSDGDGSLSASELGTAMQSVLPPPSTLAFAQSRSASGGEDGGDGASGHGGPHGVGGSRPPPPPSGGVQSSSASSEEEVDPLDTNGDGVVSAAERAAADEADPLKALMETLDSDQDGQVSKTEVDSFVQQLKSQLEAAAKEYAQTASASSGTAATGSVLSTQA